MEESIKIQEEFENLIEQLERLKKINELTSANAESSHKVLNAIDKFILSTNEYKEKLEEDLISKSDSIDKLIIHLDKSIVSLGFQTQDLTKIINSSFSILKEETGSNFSSLTEAVSDKIVSAQKSIAELKNTLIEKSEKSESNLIKYHTNQIVTLTRKIDENKINFISKYEVVIDKIESAQKSVSELKNTLIEKSEKSESNLIEYHTKQIITLTSKIDENKINIINKFETQDKEIKNLKTLLFIICGLIFIGIIVTILK